MTNIVITETARQKTKWDTKTHNSTINEVRKSSKNEGRTKLGITFKRIANAIYLM